MSCCLTITDAASAPSGKQQLAESIQAAIIIKVAFGHAICKVLSVLIKYHNDGYNKNVFLFPAATLILQRNKEW